MPCQHPLQNLGFQSTPALVGRALDIFFDVEGWIVQVSIHARPCGTGALITRLAVLQTLLCFNPRPPLWDGRSLTIDSFLCRNLFQSTPALVGRALGCYLATRPGIYGFNPRPPLWDGRSGIANQHLIDTQVSIHARPCGTGARQPRFCTTIAIQFQSTPALVGRAL